MINGKVKKSLSLLVIVSMLGVNGAFAAANYSSAAKKTPIKKSTTTKNYATSQPAASYYNSQTLRGHLVTVPSGVSIPAVASSTLSSAYLTMGQTVAVTLGSDFYYNSTLIAPAGSTASGIVTQVTKAKHGTINGALRVRFTEITTPYGTRIPISANIKTTDGTGLLKAGTKMDTAKGYAKNMAVGSAAGAITGLVASAISGGAIGKGTAIMTGVGAGAGALKSAWNKGEDVEIPAGTALELQLDQPITVNPTGNSYDY